MEKLERATNDITVQIVFNNAGYCIMGVCIVFYSERLTHYSFFSFERFVSLKAFAKTQIEKILKNIECNAVSHVKITHHFMSKMVEKHVKGAIVFTGSAVEMKIHFDYLTRTYIYIYTYK
jgi:short-subunit dehydrogenase